MQRDRIKKASKQAMFFKSVLPEPVFYSILSMRFGLQRKELLMRRPLQITLLVFAFIPFALGLMNLITGAAQFMPPEVITASNDSQMRFYAVLFMMPFFITIWIVRNLDIAGPIMAITFGTMALAGVARLYSISQFGLPEPSMIGAIVIEIGVLLFIPWHRAVLRREQAKRAQHA